MRKPWWLPSWVLDRLDAAYFRAQDRKLLKNPDLVESLRQMRAGEFAPALTRREQWKSRAHPEVPARHVLIGDDREQATDDLSRLGQELGVDDPVVCTVHQRFVPCRKDNAGCRLTSDPELVESVRRFQQEISDELKRRRGDA
jgi:hypothetical protein